MYYPNPKGSETMKRITKIEAAGTKQKKLRVAAYARVSTDSDKQLVSLETQKNHYEKYIKARPDWEFAGLYFDEGISGTKMDRRDGLKRLLVDCDKGLIDYIIVKSISRLARNTVDSIEIVRKLFQQGIFIYFEKEYIKNR
jgi:site-specific DNA recombinase